jgi:VWFA-related protein
MRELVSALLACLGLSWPAAAGAQAVFRTGVDLVHFGVTVVDRRGELVTDLSAADFEVVEGGVRQSIAYFARGSDPDADQLPLHLGLLFDTSGSMVDDIKMARSAAIKFLNAMERARSMTLVDFDTEVRVARFGPLDFPRLVERLRGRKPDGWTALYDALGVYLDGAEAEQGQKILVLYTDGGDTRSTLSFADTLELVRASSVTIYAIGFLEHQPSSVRLEQRMRLQQLAEATGGLAYFPQSIKQLDEFYDKVRAEIHGRYTIGYHSTDARQDGAWRKVEIRLRRPDLKGVRIRTRAGYYGPYAPPSKVQP